MKLLKKLRLINWHYFLNSKIDFGMINFLTGENAAGKSTLIDAMQVLLLGDTSGRSFNKAANEKSGRTLKSYLRGEIGDNDDGSTKYLRNGRFSSYIAMEFYDDVEKKPFTVGIVFDMYDDGSEEHKFFFIRDKFPENDFCINNIPMAQKQLQEYLSITYEKDQYTFCDSNVQYQNLLKEKFGNLKDKYFSLFKKAVSFTPITNIEQFITDYVCDVPSEINIESMKANITAYERLKAEADYMEIKIRSLEEIATYYNKILAEKEKQKLSRYISNRISYQIHFDQIIQFQNGLQVNESRIQEIDEQLKEIKSRTEKLDAQKEQLIGYKVSSDSYRLINDLKKNVQEANRNIEAIEAKLNAQKSRVSTYANNFKNICVKLGIILDELKSCDEKRIAENCEKLAQIVSKMSEESTNIKTLFETEQAIDKTIVQQYAEQMRDFKNDASEIYGSLKSTLAEKVSTYATLKSQLSDYSSAGKSYDYAFMQVKSQLAHALEDYYHKKIDVSIYADLVDIRSVKWVKAIEGFIYSQKTNLFVEPEYYETANKILPEILRRNKYFRVGLVDAEKLREQDFVCHQGSVAEEIVTSHQGARDYTNFLLGNIYKCETFAEARNSGRGLLPNCTGYRNFSSFVIQDNFYKYPVIGRSVSEEHKKVKQNELNEQVQLIDTLRALVDSLGFASRLDIMSNNEITSALEIFEQSELLPELKKNLTRYQNDLDQGVSQEAFVTDQKIEAINKELEKLDEQRQALILEKGSLQTTSESIKNEKIPEQIKESNRLQEELEKSFDKEWVNRVGNETFVKENDEGLSLTEIRYKYDEIYAKAQNSLRTLTNIFNDLRKNYIVTHKLSFDITREDNDDFEKELINLRDVRLPEYRIKIEDARLKATKEFKDDFIFKLKTSIEQARTQIDELNEALKDARFGQDSYEFTVQPNPQYIDYYKMITDELLLETGSDDEAFLEKHQDIMDNLFRMIGEGTEKNANSSIIAQNIEKFTDYRTYLLFDLKVRKPDNRTYSLSRNMKKASGGETQTPFYISILASFSQLYRVKASTALSNCSRLVVFDEAFSKMDRNRIVEAIRILKQFDLQVILSAPPEKVNDISKIVDQTLVVTRSNNRSFIDPYNIKKE